MKSEKMICPICDTEYEGEMLVDGCPYCDWVGDYLDSEDEYSSVNYMTIRQAKENFAKGLNIWGDPLPEK